MSIQHDEDIQVFAGAGRIGVRNPLIEGTPKQIAEAHRAAGVELEIERARHAGYREYAAEDLEYVPRWKIWLDDDAGRILERVHVLEADRDRVVGFTVGTDGLPVYFRICDRSQVPSTPFMWRAQQNHTASKARIAALERRAELITMPLEPVTLAEIHGSPLPTLREAAEIVSESGKIGVIAGQLTVQLRVRGDRELDAARVLHAAEALVVSTLNKEGNVEVEKLPNKPVLAGGRIA